MPENQIIEWKSSWRDEYLKWVCGFANAQGGVLEIGKDDRGAVVGLADSKKLLEDIPSKINSSMAIVADVDLREEGGLEYLVITVEPYPSAISYHGRYYYRSGATNRELTGNALDEFVLKKQGRTWDGVPVPYAKVSDLDPVAFRDFRRKALSSKRLTEEDLAVSDAELIDSLRLTDGRRLRRAAACEAEGRPAPVFSATSTEIKVSFFTPITDGGGGALGDSSHQVSHQVGHQVTDKASKLLRRAAVGPASRAELLGELGIFNDTRNAKRHVEPLVASGWLEPTDPDSPRSPVQRYRITNDDGARTLVGFDGRKVNSFGDWLPGCGKSIPDLVWWWRGCWGGCRCRGCGVGSWRLLV